MSSLVVDESNAWYTWGDNKFGDTVETFYDDKLDIEYLTFDISDYSTKFSFLACSNQPMSSKNKYTSYYQYIIGSLDLDKIVPLDDVTDSDEYGYNILKASKRGDATTAINYWSQVDYTGNANALGAFDEVEVTKNEEEYTVKCHVSDPSIYSDFMTPNGLSSLTVESVTNWDALNRYTWDSLSVDEEGFITVKYTNAYEAFMGRYVFFENNESIDTTDIFYCCLSISPVQHEYHDYTFTNENGVRIETNTMYVPESAEINVTYNENILSDIQSFLDSAIFTESPLMTSFVP